MHEMAEEENTSLNKSTSQLPLYERPGRLNPDRHIPMDRRTRVDVNVHYEDANRGYYRDSDTPSFTEESANAMAPFEDSALLKGEVKPKVVAVRTGAPKPESKVFVPELDTTEVRAKIKEPVKPVAEPEEQIYIAEEDKAASSDYIADAFSGVETLEKTVKKPGFQIVDVNRLKTYILLLGVVILLEVSGIALLLFI